MNVGRLFNIGGRRGRQKHWNLVLECQSNVEWTINVKVGRSFHLVYERSRGETDVLSCLGANFEDKLAAT